MKIEGLAFKYRLPKTKSLSLCCLVLHVQCCNGNRVLMQQSFTTFSTFLEMRATLLQPLVGRVCVRNFKTQPTPGQCLAV